MSANHSAADGLLPMLRGLKLPAFAEHYQDVGLKADSDGWTATQYLRHLVELEVSERRRRRVERNLKASCLPAEKTLATLDPGRLPTKVRRQLPSLCAGDFIERADNVLAFGLPGRGKTHLLSAVGHELIKAGYEVLFVPAFVLVQRLLVAKRNLALEKECRWSPGSAGFWTGRT